MSINATLLAQMLVFGALVWFSMKYVWPMIMGAMAERETRIADGLASAERGQQMLNEAQTQRDSLLGEGREKAQDFVTQAERRAKEIVEEARDKAKIEAERIVVQAQAQIEQERNEVRESLRKDVAALAVKGAEQILGREVDAKAHSDALSRLSAQL